MEVPLNWLFFGAGAIGSYIGGSLELAAQTNNFTSRVAFIETPEVADEIRRRGLHMKIGEQEVTLDSIEVVSSIPQALELGSFDVAVFALKSYDTLPALQGITPYSQQLPPFLCLQNGVENEPALASILGDERVIAGTVTSSVGRHGAGDIILERLRGMGVASSYPLSSRIVTSLNEAGLNAQLFPNALDLKWSKMLTNLLANATSAILDMTPAEVFSHPRLYRLEIKMLREALLVMNALNIQVVDLPGTPTRLLAFAIQRLPPGFSRPLLQRAVGKGRGAKMPSFHIDLHSGRKKNEVEYLNGAVVRFGERTGIPTPVNQILTETLLDLTHKHLPISEYSRQPEKLLRLVGR
jgi:2-dehydropantoate 2-reductase